MSINQQLLTQYFLRSGKIEGYSYLLLLGIAMPLKYVWNQPEWVRIVGMIHGVLFVLFMLLIGLMIKSNLLSLKNGFWAFVLSLLPFGTFFLNRLVKK